ncbi:MAG: peptide ABC transporter [Chloroflexi bacterium RBG_16_48_7]|nr:MAG: peptide ABC transporter [Chloroflexi bacterium RBG_16_48_7]
MGAFIVRRIVLSIVVLFLVSLLAFMIVQLLPGDPALTMLGQDASKEQVELLRHELWLDRPLAVQYWHWLSNAAVGNFGKSITFQESVSGLVANRLPITLNLSLISLVISTILGVGFGIICAIRRGGWLDTVITLFANLGIAVPIFWLGILGIYFFGLKLGWLPIQGYTSPLEDFAKSARQLVMPVICMSVFALASLTRQTRSSMLEVVRQDYIRTAWSKGLKERVIVMKHALKNALIPVVTLLGMELRIVVGGSVVVETVFNIPGMGRLLVSSVLNKDFVVVQACVLIIGLIVLVANLIVDISYGWLDPRIRYD